MLTLLVAIGSFVGFLVAYHTYGRWLARKIFAIDPAAPVPSQQLRDNVDFVPTHRQVIFGHHFTSIAGTGPIVGPAIAVFWGWLPALLWVVFGSIFIGAVHDFGALVVSLRNRGQTVGEVAGRMIAPRAKVLFLLVLFFALTVVLAIFGLVIASIFKLYPESVLSVWIAMPVAVLIGLWVYRGGSLLIPSILALMILYAAVYVGTEYWPVQLPASWGNPTIIWTVILFVYCFVASVLPVWLLLQPRDYINSHQLMVALSLLMIGICFATTTGKADLLESAPAIAEKAPVAAPPLWPFLFITIACGAVSGFHCLVSSGTSSKQLANEQDAQYVGYGAMLLEGALAVIVILACCAGVGMGKFTRQTDGTFQQAVSTNGEVLVGRAAWIQRYNAEGNWNAFGLGQKLGAFIEGGGNFLATVGIPLRHGIAIIAVLVACFAATTLDTATRLQRYVIQELAGTFNMRALTNKYAATGVAVAIAFVVAMLPGPTADGSRGAYGTGGLYLWPLFGATNQLLAGMAFLVTVFYLYRRNKPVWFALLPMALMIVMPFWALCWQLFNEESGWWPRGNYLLVVIGLATMVLQVWMVIEAIVAWPRAKGVLEENLPAVPVTGNPAIESRLST